MGKPSPTETERNKALYNDWKSGLKGRKLATKYGITKQRCYQIIEREIFYEVVPSLENDQI